MERRADFDGESGSQQHQDTEQRRIGAVGALLGMILHDVTANISSRPIRASNFCDRHGDPRAWALLEALARSGADRKLTHEIPERIAEATGEFVNIDYALAVLVHALDLAPGHELVLFSMARTVGWIAHACEQLQQGRLIRPRARYVGPAPGRSAVRA